VPSDKIGELFEMTESGLRLALHHSALPDAKAKAQKEIAVLIAAGRSAGGIDSGATKISAIREACEQLHVVDRNFTRSMSQIANLYATAHVDGEDAMRLKSAGWDEAKRLALRYLTE